MTNLKHPDEYQDVESNISQWLQDVIIGLNLCPFARKPYREGGVRIKVDESVEVGQFLDTFIEELGLLHRVGIDEVETTLLVTPKLFDGFDDYLDMLSVCEQIIEENALDGIFQIASFHPDYCFADVAPSDVGSFTNRAPYPVFHLLREESITRAKLVYPDVEKIPDTNVKRIKAMSHEQLERYFPWLLS